MSKSKKWKHTPAYAKVGEHIVRVEDIDTASEDAEQVARAQQMIVLFGRVAELVEHVDVTVALGVLVNVLAKLIMENSDSYDELRRDFDDVVKDLHITITNNLQMPT